jgi:peptidoglycan/xylan/chitin deacetylase (PgdA/CDA1 family)
VRWWTLRRGNRLVILNYHRAADGDLRSHLLYLRRHYRILHLEPALEELYASPKERKQRKDRRPPLVITFDDGFYDNYTHAFKLACELQTPLTLFLVPGYIENRHRFWWLEGEQLVQQAQVKKALIAGQSYDLERLEERKALELAIDTRLRYAESVAEREEFLVSARQELAVRADVTAKEEPTLPMSWREVQEMQRSEWISFGAHTMYHPILAYLTDSKEVQREVEQSRQVLEQYLENKVSSFAYPVGKNEHIGDVAYRAVQQAGFRWALTTIEDFNTAQCDPYLLKRIGINVNRHWLEMAAQVAGVWGFFARLRALVSQFRKK